MRSTADPVAHGLLNSKLRTGAEHAINPAHHSKAEPSQSPTSGSDFGKVHRVESIDFQRDQANDRQNGALDMDDSSRQPVGIEDTGSAFDQKGFGQPAQPDGASAPVHEPKLEAIIAHHEPILSVQGPPADLVGQPPTGKDSSLRIQPPMPGIGPFPPNYVSDAPVPKLLKPDVSLFLCNFEKHNCGMRNQRNIGRHFNPESNGLGNQPG
ncbi:unnamed protein product, partial [Ixodes hexagonus]